MTENDIGLLIAHGEDTRIEYKRTLNFADKTVRAELALDILAMANAHDASPGYILIGVDEGNPPALHGVTGLQLDDGTIHSAVEPYMEPAVDFSFRHICYNGVTLGLITVPPSNERFHIVKKDFTQGARFALSQGDVWIRSGARRRRITGFDMQRLKNDWLQGQAPAQPKLDLTFLDGHRTLQLDAEWKQAIVPVRVWRAAARIFRGFAISNDIGAALIENPEDVPMPCSTMPIRFQIHNRGKLAAEKVIVTVDIPNGCSSWVGATLFKPNVPNNPEWETKLGVRSRRISLTGDQLVHGLHRTSDVVCIRFPSLDQVYEFHWMARAGNMMEPCHGILRLKPQ